MTRRTPAIAVLLAALLALCAPSTAPAQPDEGDGGGSATAPGPGLGALAPAAAPATGSGEVTINVRDFGVGDRARAGSWIGVLLEVTDQSDKVRNVIVRLRVPDVDGDAALMQRVIVCNPGAAQRVWMYTRLPFMAEGGSIFDVTAHEAVESGSGDRITYSPGRLLGTQRFQPSPTKLLGAYVGAICLVGGRDAGLSRYPDLRDAQGSDTAATGHELTELVSGVRAADLPDRWLGYDQFQALVWTAFGEEDRPGRLSDAQISAIREWVRRGGHLVVVLPSVAQPWVGGDKNRMDDLMPRAVASRAEGVDLDRYRRLLTADNRVAMPKDGVVHSMTPAPGASPDEFLPVMTGPDDECVVARRTVGSGAVTVIGLDVASPRLNMVQNALQTDVFWNRVLGKRLRTVSREERALARSSPEKPMANGQNPRAYEYDVKSANLDGFLRTFVNNTGKASLGVLLALLVFVAYWLLAGPLGYFVLKQRGWKRHAWVGFVGATALFTAVAWGGASALKPQRVAGRHFTVLDAVYGQPLQRARSWMGLVLPRYGDERLSVAPAATEGGAGDAADINNAIAPWDAPRGLGAASEASFPDNRAYVVESRRPDTLVVPVRSTTKDVQVEWLGALPSAWGMVRPVADPAIPVGQEIRWLPRTPPSPTERAWTIEGTVVHNLPAALTNVCVYLIATPERLSAGTDTATPYRGWGVKLVSTASNPTGNEWKPGQPMALDPLFGKTVSSLNAQSLGPVFKALVPKVSAINYGPETTADEPFQALTFLDMLEPPQPTQKGSYSRAAVRRYGLHGLDLSRWCVQPALIIIGELGDEGEKTGVECPVPLAVGSLTPDEVRPRVRGKTLVRWVYPLGPAPMKAEPAPAPAPSDADPAEPTPDDDPEKNVRP